jgi:type IV secretion system protein VirB1
MELMSCPELAVPPEVMHHVVRVESSHNPYAIGVVGGHLVRQPKNLPEALATVRMLESRGFNFSLGVAQVNRYNLGKYGLDSYEKAFEVCPNLQAGSRILAECYSRSGGDWGKSFSCYYSGNFVTGYRHGYVQKIYASMRQTAPGSASAPQGQAIPVVSKPSRRTVGVTRYPVYVAPLPDPAVAATSARAGTSQSIAAPDPSQAALMRTLATTQEQPVVVQSMSVGAQPAQAPIAADSPVVPRTTAAELPAVDAAFVF